MREEASDDAVLGLHGVEVAVTVSTADRHPGDEVVEHEVVEDDDSRPATERVDDPCVRIGVVPDVVEGEVDSPWCALAAVPDDGDVDALLERRAAAGRCSPRRRSSRAASG